MPNRFADIAAILQEFASLNLDLPLPDGKCDKAGPASGICAVLIKEWFSED
jgi:hypothetical protein